MHKICESHGTWDTEDEEEDCPKCEAEWQQEMKTEYENWKAEARRQARTQYPEPEE